MWRHGTNFKVIRSIFGLNSANFPTIWNSGIRCESSKVYSKTVLLPKTPLPLNMTGTKVIQRDSKLIKLPHVKGLYQWQRKRSTAETYTLHDGPPYANGSLHAGHFLNKTLKDVLLRYKILRGYKVDFRPGWDCHGLPIEQKILANLRQDIKSISSQEIRSKARKFALETVASQKQVFESWGITGDWNNSYLTLHKSYEYKQMKLFQKLHSKGLITQNFMPVHWSPSSRTALGESELEYNSSHRSLAVYVRFSLRNFPSNLNVPADRNVFLLIWTTTPWTLPFNQAVAFGSGIRYSFTKVGSDTYLVSSTFVPKLFDILGSSGQVLLEVSGRELKNCHYEHPMLEGPLPLVNSNNALSDKGTGLVHTAPAHGLDDYRIAKNHALPILCLVDEDGRYSADVSHGLAGKCVLTEANELVVAKWGDSIVKSEEFVHSYPYDWRTKEPTILRASKQWFLDVGKLKDEALCCLQEVSISPSNLQILMSQMMEQRSYWCISRQRAWGVPIPALEQDGKVLLDDHIIEHAAQVLKKHGSDAWWTLPDKKLRPKSAKYKAAKPCREILDIWFESGTSWKAVNEDCVADTCIEGHDQLRGWFQSSLLLSVADRGKAPFRNLYVHGFVVDENGHKMSKSLGNVVDPQDVILGTNEVVGVGIDVLRCWAALAGLNSLVKIGKTAMANSNEKVYEIRKSIRYLLGSLHNFDVAKQLLPVEDLMLVDRHTLNELHRFSSEVTELYDCCKFDCVMEKLQEFMSTTLAFHSNVSKDRLYCDALDSLSRLSAQTAKFYLFQILLQTVAPILPMLAEEVFSYSSHLFPPGIISIFHCGWHPSLLRYSSESLSDSFRLAEFLRGALAKHFSITSGLFDQVVYISCSDSLDEKLLLNLESDSSEFSSSSLFQTLQCAECHILPLPSNISSQSVMLNSPITDQPVRVVLQRTRKKFCLRCRLHHSAVEDSLCERCERVLSQGWE